MHSREAKKYLLAILNNFDILFVQNTFTSMSIIGALIRLSCFNLDIEDTYWAIY